MPEKAAKKLDAAVDREGAGGPARGLAASRSAGPARSVVLARGPVAVRDVTRNALLADRAEVARGVWKLLVGLIPYRELGPGQGMILPRTGSIHTSFLRFEIDVLFLDRNGRVLRGRHAVRPFRIAWAPRGTRTAVELPAGVLRRAACQEGDEVTIGEAPPSTRIDAGADDPAP